MSEHLTPLDATFLELEEADESAHMHIGAIMVFDPRPDGGVPSREDLGGHLARRLGQLPRYGQRLSEPHTGGLRWPEWEDDPALDLGRHVARAALPAPGGHEELQEWASGFFSQRLDRHRPLWEMALVEGLANDVVLAVTASGVRALLCSRGETLPAEGLRAMVPMNVRTAGDHLALGNRITSLFVELPVAEPDLVRRYRETVARSAELKSDGRQAQGTTAVIELAGLAPPVIHATIAQALYASRLFNLTVTNVPGAQETLYAFGAPLREVHPLVPLAAEHALGVAVLSYDGSLFFGVVADRDAVPDLDVLLCALGASVEQLLAAARNDGVAPTGS